jgi:hypothetical protein
MNGVTTILQEASVSRTPARFLTAAAVSQVRLEVARKYEVTLSADLAHTVSGVFATKDSIQNDSFLIITSFPTLAPVMEVYQMVGIPYLVDGSFLQPVLEHEFFIIDQDWSTYAVLSELEKSVCVKGPCTISGPFRKVDKDGCGVAFLAGHTPPNCPTVQYDGEAFFRPILTGLLYSVRKLTPIRAMCERDGSGDTSVERGSLDGAGFLQIEPGCDIAVTSLSLTFPGPPRVLGVMTREYNLDDAAHWLDDAEAEQLFASARHYTHLHVAKIDNRAKSVARKFMYIMMMIGSALVVLAILVLCCSLRMKAYIDRIKANSAYWFRIIRPSYHPVDGHKMKMPRKKKNRWLRLLHFLWPRQSVRSAPSRTMDWPEVGSSEAVAMYAGALANEKIRLKDMSGRPTDISAPLTVPPIQQSRMYPDPEVGPA